MQAILCNDRKATAEFVTRCADDVYGYVRSRLAPRYDGVDDLVQEIFWHVEEPPEYRGRGPWNRVMGIARHKVKDYYRDCLRAPESLDETDTDHPRPGRC